MPTLGGIPPIFDEGTVSPSVLLMALERVATVLAALLLLEKAEGGRPERRRYAVTLAFAPT